MVDSDPGAIAAFVRSRRRILFVLGLKAGRQPRGCAPSLGELGVPVICIDARHAKAVLKMQINKSDRNDAVGIPRIMQTGWFKEVRVKVDCHAVKALLTSRALLVKITHVSSRSSYISSRSSYIACGSTEPKPGKGVHPVSPTRRNS